MHSNELRPGGVEAMMAAQGIDDADIVEKLRYTQHYTNAKWAGDAADEIERLRLALSVIKDRVCGEAAPNWDNTPATTFSRGWIADECDVALRTF